MVFDATPQEAAILAQVRQRESRGDYSAIASLCNPTCASGAYQFKDSTWRMAAANTGVGTQFATAGSAPPEVQDINALWLLRYAGGNPNASIAWAASGPYSTAVNGALVDLTGEDATAPTPSIMDQINAEAAALGVDLSSPATEVAIALAIGAAVYLVMG